MLVHTPQPAASDQRRARFSYFQALRYLLALASLVAQLFELPLTEANLALFRALGAFVGLEQPTRHLSPRATLAAPSGAALFKTSLLAEVTELAALTLTHEADHAELVAPLRRSMSSAKRELTEAACKRLAGSAAKRRARLALPSSAHLDFRPPSMHPEAPRVATKAHPPGWMSRSAASVHLPLTTPQRRPTTGTATVMPRGGAMPSLVGHVRPGTR